MAEIHSKDLVRVSGGRRILDYDTYIDNYKVGFERNKATGQTSDISLRFFERVYSATMASERGIYKLVAIKARIKNRPITGNFMYCLRRLKVHGK
ncbi:hypothetical protein [Winogradskyella sp.]|uniref:hypothetical protein n=1 Tax=Winogradskyella sp. TaxID=1883156 RepID=UPI00345CCFF9